MSKHKRGNKNVKLRFSREEAVKLLNGLFELYGKHVVFEPEFRRFFKVHKHLSDEEINDLLAEGRFEYKIIDVGVEMHGNEAVLVIWRPEDLGESSIEDEDRITEALRRHRKDVFTVKF